MEPGLGTRPWNPRPWNPLEPIHGTDDTDTGIVIYTDKATEAADHHNYAQMIDLNAKTSTKIVKLDQGNYINVLASGKLICQ